MTIIHETHPYALLDAVPMGIFILDAAYRVRFWNVTLEDWTDIPREEIVGTHVEEYFPHLTAARYVSRLKGVFAGGPPTIFSSQLHHYVIPVARPDGKPRTQHTTVTAVETASGNYLAMFTIQDVDTLDTRIKEQRRLRKEAQHEIEERRAMQAALSVSEARYRALSEMISDFAFSLVRQSDGLYTRDWVTDAFAYITGYTTEEFTALDDWKNMVHPEDLSDVKRVFQTLEVARVDEQIDHRIITKSGDVRYVQMFLRPLVDQNTQRVTGIFGAAQDITRRKAAETQLRMAEQRFRQISENLDIAILIGDYQTDELVYTNSSYERVIGPPRRRLYTSPMAVQNIIHPDDHTETISAIQAASKENERIDITYRIRRNGNPDDLRWIRDRRFPIEGDEENKSYRYICLIEDVTDLREASEREFSLALEREQISMLSSFISDATHEFRTPLSIISSSIYLLEKMSEPEKRERYVTLIKEQVDAISELVDVLILMAGLDSDVKGEDEYVDVNGVMQMVLDQFGVRLREARHIVTTDFYGAPLYVEGRPRQLWQAIVALVENAIRYTPEGGRITLRSALVDKHVQLEVQDNGVGIDAADVDRIFDRFYRGDQAHSTRGFGLGLPIAQKIVEGHNGKIEVESAVGAGSLFRVTLPQAPPPRIT